MVQPYEAPPITEAVIEIRFTTPFSQDDLAKASRRLADIYPLVDQENFVEVELVGPTARAKSTPFGFKQSSVDQTDIVQLRPSLIALSRRAPYLGWEAFEPAFIHVMETLRRSAGLSPPTRFGVRYINRIDIPSELVAPREYVRMFTTLPEGFPAPFTAQSVHVVSKMPDEKCEITVNASTIPSPLVGHASLQLDIDVARTVDLSARENEVRAILASMRAVKNHMFEVLVTDKARELFSK